MKSINIHIRDIEYCYSSSNAIQAIWGKIYFEINGFYFPDDEWSDAISSLLHMWTTGITDFIQTNRKQCSLYFMDGPYTLHLTALSDNLALLVCRDSNRIELKNTILNVFEFAQNILEATSQFIELCCQKDSNFINTKTYLNLHNACLKLNRILHGSTCSTD